MLIWEIYKLFTNKNQNSHAYFSNFVFSVDSSRNSCTWSHNSIVTCTFSVDIFLVQCSSIRLACVQVGFSEHQEKSSPLLFLQGVGFSLFSILRRTSSLEKCLKSWYLVGIFLMWLPGEGYMLRYFVVDRLARSAYSVP